MFEESYPYRYINHQSAPEPFKHICHNYSFYGKNRKRYIVNVEQYEHNIYCAKFYLAEHKFCDHKFKRMANQFECSRVIQTIANIILELYHKNPFASFLFIGSNSIDENKDNTRRFKLYTKIIKRKATALNCEQYYISKYSAYFLFNRFHNSNIDLLLELEKRLHQVFN